MTKSVFQSYAGFRSIPELHWTRQSPAEPQPAFFKRNEPVAADDQMVEHVNIQQLAGLHQGARHGHILEMGQAGPRGGRVGGPCCHCPPP